MKAKPDFISAWIRNPRQVGALLPSSECLAQAMAAQVSSMDGLTIELGAGTGAVTSALLGRGINPKCLVVVEKDQILAEKLISQFPSLSILAGDASRLQQLLKQNDLGLAENVVSSLPLLNMRMHTRIRVLTTIFNSLSHDGKLIQYTYSPAPPIPKQLARSMQVVGFRIDRILWNFPPAHVWVYRRFRTLLNNA
ncbi:MAG: methyltransferase [Candidatus Thiodiazotropha lotti]|uniref:Methyltransferase n=1 Tax=Candidatus Thiodiazotropha lotti TaxID=2792787 RepID=A0A9E4K7D1_9GAMM|nr:methyltransferase [Candidatus Thiodiazotropha lotti]MCG7988286.1 methyltransferase [Candidatus Thiodiazotropha lotti]MCG8012966.1 methyltransferase [Candidatus Thiodiazotropha lotti]MCG8020975.1 methyltransferase [Candidatus Thiodiazotropha lotti]MCW4204569.1 methyltransferase [Candidatus Thiodiazotropha lotti]